jgi:hypothetical protein
MRQHIKEAHYFITVKAGIMVVNKKYSTKLLMKYFIDRTIRLEVLLIVLQVKCMKQDNNIAVSPFNGRSDAVCCIVFIIQPVMQYSTQGRLMTMRDGMEKYCQKAMQYKKRPCLVLLLESPCPEAKAIGHWPKICS